MPTSKTKLAQKLKAQKANSETASHLVISARAGTGKTTTLIEGLKRIKGIPSELTPSKQQAAVWAEMERSKGQAQTICFVAFGKDIANELRSRVPEGCEASTTHAMGLKAVSRHFGRVKVDNDRVDRIIEDLTKIDIWDLREDHSILLQATRALVGLVKQTLAETDQDSLIRLASHYDIDMNGSEARVLELVPQVIERCKDVAADMAIDFNDMIWIPVVRDLQVYRFDLLLVDEAQDLNRCRQALVMKAGRRIIICGDPKQAIFGFTGADTRSMDTMKELLGATDRGVVELKLTVTRRCGKAIVALAQQIVPDFEAFETNPEGKISYALLQGETENRPNYNGMVEDGDMVICRVNAPLVSQCFRFLKAGRKANILGRQIGQGLISTIKKFKVETVADLTRKLDEWHAAEIKKEQARKFPNDNRMIALQDRRDCLDTFCEGLTKVSDVIARVEKIFTDNRDSAGIRLASGHKSKGLEAKRVFILMPKGAECPHPMAKTPDARDQENNLLYVMRTRAIEELVIVN